MPVIQSEQKSHKTIWQSLKEFFWEPDNIGDEVPVQGDTPEQTEALRKTLANADKRYNALNNSSKGGKESSIVVEKAQVDEEKAIINAKQKAVDSRKVEIKGKEQVE